MSFIAIDGLDGSGKATQSALLATSIEGSGKRVRRLSFPVYDSKSSTFVKMYLSGELGKNAGDTNAYAASSFFSMDRYVSFASDWKSDYERNDTVIIADRYTSANAVHQLSKLDKINWDCYLNWLIDFEYNKLMLPKPDLVMYLEVTPEISMKLIESRSKETGRTKDIHELDPDFLKRSYEAALYASDALGWAKIRCFEGDSIRPIDDIAAEIRGTVKSRLGF
ncbi:MAG: thymidylate kinase [Ruminococcaceae bacterium]|nr:thymidylate kinase [Oscillospiraceae bacterium]